MDGNELWTDELSDDVIALLVEQIFGEYFEYSAHDTDQCKNNLHMNYCEYSELGLTWTWDEEE
jgi:hypothetical protein